MDSKYKNEAQLIFPTISEGAISSTVVLILLGHEWVKEGYGDVLSFCN